MSLPHSMLEISAIHNFLVDLSFALYFHHKSALNGIDSAVVVLLAKNAFRSRTACVFFLVRYGTIGKEVVTFC